MQNLIVNIFSFSTPQLIAILVSIGVFALIVFISVIRDEIQSRNARVPRSKNEWLFSNWDIKLYDAFTKTDPKVMLVKLGVNLEDYYKNCYLIKKGNINYKKLAADKLVGMFIMFVAIVLFAVSGVSGIIFSIALFLFGYIFYGGDEGKVKKEAFAQRRRLEAELPRFLDLLETALFINIPVSEAIVVTSAHLKDSIISEELMSSMAETKLGSTSWQKAMQDMAIRYEVDSFSDFVQYLITGYEKGLPIYDVVSRQAEEVRKIAMMTAEEKANKLNSSITVPIAIFKLFPLVILAAYPMVIQFLEGNSIF